MSPTNSQSIRPPTISSIDKSLSRNHHRVRSQTHRHAIKVESKVANHDLVDYQACSLLQYINVIANLFTCVALAKAGLVVGPLRPSVRLSVRPSVCRSVRPSVCPSATLLGCLVCVICNFKSFHSFLFKFCIMILYILKMCTSYFVNLS